MSVLRHNLVVIILMVIVVIVAQLVPCRANHLYKHGKQHALRYRENGKKLRGELHSHCKEFIKPVMIKDEGASLMLGRHRLKGNGTVNASNQFVKTNGSSNKKNSPKTCKEGKASKEENQIFPPEVDVSEDTDQENEEKIQNQRQKELEQMQNEAADQEFERIMANNLQRNPLKGCHHANRPLKNNTEKNLYESKSSIDISDINDPANKNNFKKSNLMSSPESEDEISPRTELCVQTTPRKNTTPDQCTEVARKKICKPKSCSKIVAADRLLKITRAMKKHALLIIKNLNLLEIDILNNGPTYAGKISAEEPSKSAPTVESSSNRLSSDKTTTPLPTQLTTTVATKATTAATTTSTGHTKATTVSTTTDKTNPVTSDGERLEKPKAANITTRPPGKKGRGSFSSRLPIEKFSKAYLEAALKEERKLEKKVREEHQMQREHIRSRLQQYRKQQLQCKRKRARYETAPAAAARLELMTTPHPVYSTHNHSETKGSSMPLGKLLASSIMNSLSKNKINDIENKIGLGNYLPQQRNKLQKNVKRNYEKLRKEKTSPEKLDKLSLLVHKLASVNDKPLQKQRHKRHYTKFKNRRFLNNHLQK